MRYALAKAYYDEHGELNIPAQYKSDGIRVSKWINEQRNIYIGNRPGKTLTDEQIKRLEAIGMDWGNRNHQKWSAAWDESYQDAKAYYEANGDLAIPNSYKGASGKSLARWIIRQRELRKNGKLPQEQEKLLDEIGMVWEVEDAWEIGFAHAEQYYKANGNLKVPFDYVCEDGYRLRSWLNNQRSNYLHPSAYRFLLREQAVRLEAIGMVWRPAEEQWMNGYRHAEAYMRQMNGMPYKTNYFSDDGYRTGAWIRGQYRALCKGFATPEHASLLKKIGLSAEPKETVNKLRKQTDLPMQQSGQVQTLSVLGK